MKIKITKFIYASLIVLSVQALFSCSTSADLKIFNVGEYIDPDLVTEFEDEYNCNVNYTTFDSNEAAITKMKTESYDIVVPSDYAVEELSQDDMLSEIDWSKLDISESDFTPELINLIDNLNSGDDGFDILKYGVPYFYGEVGIVYDANVIDADDVESLGWKIFQDSDYYDQVAYYDSSRDGFMCALKDLGYSMNTTDTSEIEEAYQWILKVKENTNCAFKTDELLSEMPSGKYALGLMYSGDAIYAMDIEDDDVDLQFYVPDTGTNVFIDSMVIPSNAEHVDMAYKFINFINEEENAYDNSSYVGYTSCLNNVYEEMISEGGDYYDYREYYEIEENSLDEIYRYDADIKTLLNDYWVKLKLY